MEKLKEENAKIGLEIHGYLLTKEKLFCRCKAVKQAAKQKIKPNTFICPICCGYPGAKPMLPNFEAIKKIIQISLMLNCKIVTDKKLIWQRKHYDWPDLPKGYQDTISGAYSVPIGQEGNFLGIGIRECHLEEDPAAWNPETGCIDYNRSGLPLVEIVTEPDFSSAEEVADWLKKLVLTMSYIKALEKDAGIKADVNVDTGGERVEIKNINSIFNIQQAIEYEIKRQLREGKEKVERETRRFDEITGKTIRMRGKEQQEDYRFIPDPDLPKIQIQNKLVKEIEERLPEAPDKKLDKLIKQHKINERDAKILTQNLELVEFFETVIQKIPADFALPWITIELLRVLNWNKKTLDEINIKTEHFIELLNFVRQKKITELKAKQILNDFIPESFSISEKLGKEIEKITDRKQIIEICQKVIASNKQAVADFKLGKKEAFDYLIGEIMKISNRRADYKLAREVLRELLES